jgi:hypothetical protein
VHYFKPVWLHGLHSIIITYVVAFFIVFVGTFFFFFCFLFVLLFTGLQNITKCIIVRTLLLLQVDKSRSVELQNLFAKGLGVHHAGMLRADRTLTEQLFEQGLIRVLCCTATLAWGINLPAHTVIIKGTFQPL